MREALKQVKDELGGDAVIMSNKKYADGIEIVAAYDKEPDAKLVSKNSHDEANLKPIDKTPSLSEIIGDTAPDSLKALLEKQSQAANKKTDAIEAYQPQEQKKQSPSPIEKQRPTYQNDALSEMRQELSSLRNILQFQVSGLIAQEKQRQHPLHGYLLEKLQKMGISNSLAEEVVSYTPESSDERQAWLFLLKLLANKLQTKQDDILSQPGVVALMGPTGTGKTTTIAKLAAQAVKKYGVENVAVITLDNYRIGAFDQIATYGKIIGCPVKQAQDANQLTDLLYQFKNKRLVLIDTAGYSQKDARLIKQLDTIKQNSCVNIRKYLVIQANCQYRAMQQTVNEYKKISLHGCILTKLDECYSLGEAISVAIENKLQICYLADGQRVPEDLQSASTKHLITSAAKLYKKYALIHTNPSKVNSEVAAI